MIFTRLLDGTIPVQGDSFWRGFRTMTPVRPIWRKSGGQRDLFALIAGQQVSLIGRLGNGWFAASVLRIPPLQPVRSSQGQGRR